MNNRQITFMLTLLAAGFGSTGCATIDRMGAKMDMTVNRLAEQGTHEYEGKLESIRQMGVMTALQLSGGKIYDVVDLSPGLVPGDTVRIYHTEKGYEARLWKQAKINPVVSEVIQPVQVSPSGS